MEMVSSAPVAQQAMMILVMSLFSRSSVCFSVYLRMHQNAPKVKISWRSMPPDPSRVNNCRAAMFSTSASGIAPLDGKCYVRPCAWYWRNSLHYRLVRKMD